MDKTTLKKELLSLNVFEDNQYLNQYIDLIILNKYNEYIKGKTQIHHIIPVMYYEYNNVKVNNDQSNKVNLLYKDHLLAHYLLSFCFKDNIFKYKNICAVDIILGATGVENGRNFLSQLEKIQEYYENSSYLRSCYNCMKNTNVKLLHDNVMKTDRVRKSISKTIKESRLKSKDYITIRKDKQGKRIPPEELDYYISQGWEKGLNQKGMIVIHKDGKETKIWPEALDEYLSVGWEKGGVPGRITPQQREALDASHKNISDKFREEQSKRTKNYHENHPEFRLISCKPIRVFNEDQEFIFTSSYDAAIFIGYSPKTASSGVIASLIKKGGKVTKRGKYYNWNVERYQGGDNNDKVYTD